jgi:hypothetical protein
MRILKIAVTALGLAFAAGRSPEIPFEKHTIDLGANETCAWADINGDGKLDLVSGENWYEAPKWKQHRFRALPFQNNYIDAFSDLPLDVDADGNVDLITASWFSKKLAWWRNPGRGAGTAAVWKEQVIEGTSPVEFAFLVDLDNDGQARELLPQFGQSLQPMAWYEVVKGQWVRHVVAPASYGHGIGAGDVNGDGRADILTPRGWYEAPPDPRQGEWKLHADWEFREHLSFLHVMDVNDDKRPDVVTGLAHDYGLIWLEQKDGKFERRMIDDSWSQPHAVALWPGAPKSIITGKRFMAHNGKDPGEREPLGIYWYEYITALGGKKEWARHVVDYGTRAGGGMQIAVADYDGDGDWDFAVGGKSGVFLFENLTAKKGK